MSPLKAVLLFPTLAALAACGQEPASLETSKEAPPPAAVAGDGASGATGPGASKVAESKPAETAPAAAKIGSNRLFMELKTGKVEIELRPDLAPKHVERIRKLTKEGFYNGIVFHRVIEGFMAQTGDPTGTGTGGSEYGTIKAEFTSTPFVRGTVGAARSRDPDSADSQFFICFNDTGCQSLTGSYTVWGKVVSGMENVDSIKKGSRAANGQVDAPDKIVKMYLE